MNPSELPNPAERPLDRPTPIFQVVLPYALFAAAWILGSDLALEALFNDPASIIRASLIKGWVFVVVTTLMLYLLVRRYVARLDAAHERALEATRARQRDVELLSAIASSSQDAMFAKDLDGLYLLFNDAAARLIGRSAAEVVGHDDTVIFPIGRATAIIEHERQLVAETRTVTYEETIDTKDGPRTFLTTKGPLHDPVGTTIGTFGVARDITERKAAEAELERRVAERTAELTAANHELDAFAYAVSHDLRAPLRAMSGYARALIDDHAGLLPEEGRNWLYQIELAGRRMDDLIDAILALSRSTRGQLERDTVDVSAIARRHLDELARAEPRRHVRCEVEPGLVVHGDARMIDAVVENLVGNAWKYTGRSADASIRVHRGELDGLAGICVTDNGAGFDPRLADRLFEPFQRLHRAEDFPGIGIGLATVRRIVHRHGGAIVASGAPGRGATFCFSVETRPDPG